MDVREIGCEDGRWMEAVYVFVIKEDGYLHDIMGLSSVIYNESRQKYIVSNLGYVLTVCDIV
jgi:hypothetical protein